MKLRGWEIDGFGALRDHAVAALPDGLTVVYGADEARTTTLLDFLRCMLFGASTDGGGRFHAPPAGGRRGGRLRLEGNDGEYVVARDFARSAAPDVIRPDGSAGDAADLARLLGGADEPLFRAVFAITLDNLRSFAGRDDAGIGEALLSVSLSGAGRSAGAALARLRAAAARRLDGDGPVRIGDCIAALTAIRPRLDAARRAALDYPQQRRAAAADAARVAALSARQASIRAERDRAAALLRARPLWESVQAARRELAVLADQPAPPAALAAALAQARERARAAAAAVDELRAEQADADAQLAALPGDDGTASLMPEIEALCADLALHRVQLAALPAAQRRVEEAAATLDTRLQRLGEAWDADALRDWGRLGVDRDQVRDWQARLARADDRVRDARRRAEAAERHASSLREQADATGARLPERPSLSVEEVEGRRRTLAGLRAAVGALGEQRTRGEAMAQTAADREQALRAFDLETAPAPPPWLAPILGTAAAAAAALTLWSANAGVAVLAAGGAATAAGGAGALLVAQRRRGAAAGQGEREQARRTLRSEFEAARRGRDQAWRAAAERAEQIARDAAAIGLPPAPTLDDCDALAGQLEEVAAAGARHAAARATLASLEPALRGAEEAMAACAGERASAEGAREALDAEWRVWAVRAGFGDVDDPERALERVTRLQSAHDALLACDAAERELRQAAPMVDAWAPRAAAVATRAGAEGLSGQALVDAVLALRARWQEQAPQRARRAALTAAAGERAARLAVAAARRAEAEAALAALLDGAGLRDEGEFAARHAAAARRRELTALVAEREALVAEGTGWEGAQAELAGGDAVTWSRLAADAEARLAEAERELAHAAAAQRDRAAACAALERSDEVAGLEQEWAALTAELEETVRDWRLLAAAGALVEEARLEFARTGQPAVLREASATFATVTGHRYAGVAPDEQGAALVVVDRDGVVRQAGSEIGRGTAEALYLAVRLGLASELARRGTALPLLCDDVLVTLDPARAAATAEALGDAARRHQALFFTCHPTTRDLLVRAGRAARVVDL